MTQADLQSRIAPVLPAGVEVLTGAELIDEAADATNSGMQFFNIFLLTFAFIALLVGAFLIYNTFSIIISQRTRELALMRALGASPKQVRRSVVTESFVVGAVGSAVGLGLGLLRGHGPPRPARRVRGAAADGSDDPQGSHGHRGHGHGHPRDGVVDHRPGPQGRQGGAHRRHGRGRRRRA